MRPANIETLKKRARYIRRLVLDMCVKAYTGHVTSCFSCTEILVALYYGKILRYRPKDLQWKMRDRFILSKGHASPLLYAVLADCGFFSKGELEKFCRADGMFGVHLQHDVPGVEITSGSLGQGLGVATGMALAAKMDDKSYNIFTLLGDGECYEGSIWETAMFASHHNLDNLIAIVDRNLLCVTDFTEQIVRLDPLEERFKAFGWGAVAIDGHSLEELLTELNRAVSIKDNKPKVIIAKTVKGKGVSFMENKPLWHGVAPQGEDVEKARSELSYED